MAHAWRRHYGNDAPPIHRAFPAHACALDSQRELKLRVAVGAICNAIMAHRANATEVGNREKAASRVRRAQGRATVAKTHARTAHLHHGGADAVMNAMNAVNAINMSEVGPKTARDGFLRRIIARNMTPPIRWFIVSLSTLVVSSVACTSSPALAPSTPITATVVVPTAEVATPPATPPKPERAAVGSATMSADGTIVMDMFSPHARLTYTKGDARYTEVLQHVGGLKPGESKAVPPWGDDIDDGKVNDAVAAWVAKNKGWRVANELRIQIYGTNANQEIIVGVGHANESVNLVVVPTTWVVHE